MRQIQQAVRVRHKDINEIAVGLVVTKHTMRIENAEEEFSLKRHQSRHDRDQPKPNAQLRIHGRESNTKTIVAPNGTPSESSGKPCLVSAVSRRTTSLRPLLLRC